MLVFQTSPVGVELFSYVNTFFCSNKFALDAGHVSEIVLYQFFPLKFIYCKSFTIYRLFLSFA